MADLDPYRLVTVPYWIALAVPCGAFTAGALVTMVFAMAAEKFRRMVDSQPMGQMECDLKAHEARRDS